VAGITGLMSRDAGQALTRLVGAGLVDVDGIGRYSLREDAFAGAAGAAGDDEAPAEDYGTEDPEVAGVLRRFVSDGRLLAIPSARGKRRIVLDHLARAFEIGRRYDEKEVNAILRALYEGAGPARGDSGGVPPDYVTLRRYLIDEGFLSRGEGLYWRSGGTVELG
jgi:hypothetical protein